MARISRVTVMAGRSSSSNAVSVKSNSIIVLLLTSNTQTSSSTNVSNSAALSTRHPALQAPARLRHLKHPWRSATSYLARSSLSFSSTFILVLRSLNTTRRSHVKASSRLASSWPPRTGWRRKLVVVSKRLSSCAGRFLTRKNASKQSKWHGRPAGHVLASLRHQHRRSAPASHLQSNVLVRSHLRFRSQPHSLRQFLVWNPVPPSTTAISSHRRTLRVQARILS